MYARVNIIFGERGRVDAGVAHIEGVDRTVVEAAGGNRGLTTLVDRDAGIIAAVSYWNEPSHGSEAALTQAREAAAEAARGDLVVEGFEVAVSERARTVEPGDVARIVRLHVEPARVADGIVYVREELLPLLRGIAGFGSAELLVDPAIGRGMLTTTWADHAGAAQLDTVLAVREDDAADVAGMRFTRTEGYTVVRDAAQPVG